jgi:hypothetical protein
MVNKVYSVTDKMHHIKIITLFIIDQDTPLPSSALRFPFHIPTLSTIHRGRVVSIPQYVRSQFRIAAQIPPILTEIHVESRTSHPGMCCDITR